MAWKKEWDSISATAIGVALDTQVPAAPVAGSLDDILSKTSGGNTFDKATDSLEALSNKVTLGTVVTETDLDEGDYDWTAAYPALVTITPGAGAPLSDCKVFLDLAKAAEGFAAHYAAQTIQFYTERKVDGTNWRRGLPVLATALTGTLASGRMVEIALDDVGVAESVRISAVLSAEVDGSENTQIPVTLYYKAQTAPTVTVLSETV